MFRGVLTSQPTRMSLRSSLSTATGGGPTKSGHIKHKIPTKKASSLMHMLRTEQTSEPLPYPKFRAGDALEVKMLPYKTAPKPVSGYSL
jgi:hypothetical protein